MNLTGIQAPATSSRAIADRLNQCCFCITLDRDALCDALEQEAGEPTFCATFIKTRSYLFSNVPVFLPAQAIAEMSKVVAAIEATAQLPAYRRAVLSWAPEIAQNDYGPVGAFMGYDFHLDEDGPKLIEINTNAGGAFLNALLARAQISCCGEVEAALDAIKANDFEADVARMFQEEWQHQCGDHPIPRIAIVDDRPDEQSLSRIRARPATAAEGGFRSGNRRREPASL